MTLIKTSLLTGISTVIRAIAGFIIYKVAAVYVGPVGVALMGQFQNFANAAMTFANGGINSGIVKYTAEYREEELEKNRLLSTAFLCSVTCSIIISIGLVCFRQRLSILLLKTPIYSSIFLIFGLTLIFFVLNAFMLAVLNGHKEIRKYILINIVSSLINLVLTSLLVVYSGLYGALLSYVLGQSIVFFITCSIVMRSDWFQLRHIIHGVNVKNILQLSKYSAMALTSALTIPISQLIVRNYIGDTISWEAAGCWQGVWRISEVYLMLVTTSLSVYYLPRLSEIKNTVELRKEILAGYKVILPIIIITAILIYVFRDIIIEILFTSKFLPMRGLFAFQLIGDILKIASWLLGYILVAKAMTKLFILVEVSFNLSFIILSLLLVHRWGLIGVSYAFALNYLLCLLSVIYIFRKLIFRYE